MKVLLMVQDAEDGKVKRAGLCHDCVEKIHGAVFYEVRLSGIFGPRLFVGAKAGRAKSAARRWWLVEAKSAAAARNRIAGALRFECGECGNGVAVDEDGCCVLCGRDSEVRKTPGHILAWGGKP